MLAALYSVSEQGVDVLSVVKVIGGLGGTSLLALGLLAFYKGWIVRGAEVERMRGEMAAKDAALERKDDQISALQAGLIDKAVPALARATLVLEKLSPLITTDVSVRRSE